MGWPLGAGAPQTQEASGLISSAVSVIAIVVSHNGAPYLRQTLRALKEQTHPVQTVIAIDAASQDGSAEILRQELPTGSVVLEGSARGFGYNVDRALERLSAGTSDPQTSQWLWLLHDDAEPAPDALSHLLDAVERAPSVTIAGPKLLDWHQRDKLQEVGLGISARAERETLIDQDELDQGQYDQRTDVFAVNSAGMLVRRDIFEQLGGFDPLFAGTGDDLDLAWRNRLAGHRVVVVPAAKVYHDGGRGLTTARVRAQRRAEVYLRLKHAPWWQVPFLAVGAVLGGFWRFLLAVIGKNPGYGFSQVYASLSGATRPISLTRSRAQVRSTRTRPRSVIAPLVIPRAEVRSHRRAQSALALPSVVGDGTGSESNGEYIPSGDSADDFASLATAKRIWIGFGAALAVVLLLAVSLLGLRQLIGAPALIGGAALPLSESFAQIYTNATTWWINLGSGLPAHANPYIYLLVGIGVLGFGHANAAVVALTLLALPLSALTAWFASYLFTSSRALRLWAAMAWGTAGAIFVAVGTGRFSAVLVHVALPLLLIACVRAVGLAPRKMVGGVSTQTAAILKPGTGGAHSWTSGAAAGLLSALIMACSPALGLVIVVCLILIMLCLRARAKALWWAVLLPLGLFGAKSLSSGGRWISLLGDPGFPLYFHAAPLWQALLGFPGAFDPAQALPGLAFTANIPGVMWTLIAALIIGVPTVLLAVFALFGLGKKAALARFLWIFTIIFAASGAVSQLLVSAQAPSALVAPFVGPFVSASTLMLLSAALIGATRLLGLQPRTSARKAGQSQPTDRKPRYARSILVGVVLAVGPVLSAALWLAPLMNTGSNAASAIAGTNGVGAGIAASVGGLNPANALSGEMQLRPSSIEQIPATAADSAQGPNQSTTLVLTPTADGGTQGVLAHGAGTSADQLSSVYSAIDLRGTPWKVQVAKPDGATTVLRNTIASIVAGQGVDPRPDLRDLGVAYVVLTDQGTSSEVLASSIDSVPGLLTVGKTDAGWLWRVGGATQSNGEESQEFLSGFARVADKSGATQSVLPSNGTQVDSPVNASDQVRHLVLDVRADPGWKASINGTDLADSATDASAQSWAQSFDIPAGLQGQLKVSYHSPVGRWPEIVLGILFLFTLLMAIPLPARAAQTARQTARAGGPGRNQSARESSGPTNFTGSTEFTDAKESTVTAESESRQGAEAPVVHSSDEDEPNKDETVLSAAESTGSHETSQQGQVENLGQPEKQDVGESQS